MGEGGIGTVRLFVSHAAADAELAGALSTLVIAAFDLRRSDVFASSQAGQRIQPGQPWGGPLLAEVRRADLAIALVTPAYLASTYCAIELGAFWSLGTPIVPVLVGVGRSVEIPAPLAAFEYVEPGDDAPDRIVEAVRRHRPDATVFPHRPEGTRFLALVEPADEPAEPTADRAGSPPPRAARGLGAVATATDLTVVLPSGDGLSVLQRSWAGGTATRRRLTLPSPALEPWIVGVGTYAGVGPHVEVFAATGDRRIDHVVDAGSGFGQWRTMTHPPRAPLAELHAVSSDPETLTLYALDEQGSIWRQHWAGGDGDWDGWEEIDRPPMGVTLPPHLFDHLAVTSNWPGGEDLLASDLTGGLWTGWTWAGTTEWWPFGHVGHPRALATVSRLAGHLELLVVDGAGRIHHTWRNPPEKGFPRPLGVMRDQPPAPVVALTAGAADDGSQVLVAVDETGTTLVRRLADDRWGPWSRIAATRTTPRA